ncbi:sphingomyelin phosphodiesterase [Spirillospora sp. CA-294931]|uniref:sphingomyelin phosphodiesterase n=1 Tax=Spirillospora sp. CA-294931 TaxID=3240042 RepID=UPI003D8FADFB
MNALKRLLAASGCLSLALGAVAIPASAAAEPPPLKVISYNLMLLPVAGTGNQTRADLLAKAGLLRDYDVIVLQEMFQNGVSDPFLDGLAGSHPHRTPVMGRSKSGWDQTLGDYSALTPEDGGVVVLSKYPITRKIQYVYDDACGADWWANKGFVYTTLDVGGTPAHVVGTHAQATDSTCSTSPAAIRRSQFTELDAFLDGRRIPAAEQVLIAGDYNVDRFDGTSEYRDTLALLDAAAPSYAGHSYSWDPVKNAFTKFKYPDYDTPEHLDYVLYRKGNAHPSSPVVRTLTPQSPPWTSDGRTFTEFSDHYPVTNG